MSTRKSSYTPTPTVPEELLPRLAAIVEVLAGLKTVSEAARALGLSRNHFQTILHRGVLSLSESITLKSGGRPAKPAEIARLQAQLRQLQRQNDRLQKRVDATQRLLEVAGGLLHGRLRATGRLRRRHNALTASSMSVRHVLKCQGRPTDLAERLAIERTLERRGYLRREIGGWC